MQKQRRERGVEGALRRAFHAAAGAGERASPDEALAQGKISENDIVILASFGSGFTWASAAIRW